jgi:hypothetical protein
LIKWEKLQQELGLSVDIKTIRTFLADENILHWRTKKRPGLTEDLASKRLAWAQRHVNTDWSNWLFSDECSVEYGTGRQRPWAFGFKHERLSTERVFPLKKGKQASAMVWAMIGASIGRSPIVFMQRDEDAPRNGYSALSYCWALDEHLEPVYDGQVFQQDNAPIHIAKMVQEWFEIRGIHWCHDWPPYSPDLNPIEHAWGLMKQLIYKRKPYISNLRRAMQLEILHEEIPAAWDEIREEVVMSLVASMKERVAAVIAAQGWYTKY